MHGLLFRFKQCLTLKSTISGMYGNVLNSLAADVLRQCTNDIETK